MRRLPPLATTALTVLVLSAGMVGAAAVDGTANSTTNTTADDRTAAQEAVPGPTTAPDDERWDDRLARFLRSFDLTDEQRAAILEEAREMRADGATKREILRMVVARLEAHGVDRAEIRRELREARRDRLHRHRIDRLRARYDLTDEQAAAIAAEVREMRANGASTREVRAMVRGKLVGFGVDERVEEARERRHRTRAERARRKHRHEHAALHRQHARLHRQHAKLHRRHRARDRGLAWLHRTLHRFDLTDEQVGEIVVEAHEMHHDGASNREIRAMIRGKLVGFGVLDGPAETADGTATEAGDGATDETDGTGHADDGADDAGS